MSKTIRDVGYIMTFMMSLLTIWVFFTALFNGIVHGRYQAIVDINSIGEAWFEVPLVIGLTLLIFYKFYHHMRFEARA